MLFKNCLVALAILFGWLAIDSLSALLTGSGLDVYYPLRSGRHPGWIRDWTERSLWTAPFLLAALGGLGLFFVRSKGPIRGLRVFSLILTFLLPALWIVPAVTRDTYDLALNPLWVPSMLYCNVSFALYGFVGRGTPADLNF